MGVGSALLERFVNDQQLPLHDYSDGCFVRAFFLAMGVAAEGAPANAIIYKANANVAGFSFEWHMAATVAGPDGTQLVLDPAVSARPIGESEWLDAIHAEPSQSDRVVWIAGSLFPLRKGDGLALPIVVAPDRAGQLAHAVRDMPRFERRDVEVACGWVAEGLEANGDPPARVDALRSTLAEWATALRLRDLWDDGSASPTDPLRCDSVPVRGTNTIDPPPDIDGPGRCAIGASYCDGDALVYCAQFPGDDAVRTSCSAYNLGPCTLVPDTSNPYVKDARCGPR